MLAPMVWRGLRSSIFVAQTRLARYTQLGAILAVAILIRAVFFKAAGHTMDMNLFTQWLQAAVKGPPSTYYTRVPGMNYPVGAAALFYLVGHLYAATVRSDPGLTFVRFGLKAATELADLAGAVLAYGIVRRYASHGTALLGAAAIALNPAVIYDSGYWGQIDAIPTVLALFALTQLLFGSTVVAWVALVLASLIKPPVLVLAPLFAVHAFRSNDGTRKPRLAFAALGIAIGLALSEFLAYAYEPHANPVIAANGLIRDYVRDLGTWPYTSINAFNIWVLMTDFWHTDASRVAFLPIRIYGDAVFLSIVGLLSWCCWIRRENFAFLEAAFLTLFAFFIFLPEMHERYLIYAVFFASVVVSRRHYAIAAAIIAVTVTFNLEYSMLALYLIGNTHVNMHDFAPLISRTCALVNVVTFLWLFAEFLFENLGPSYARRRTRSYSEQAQHNPAIPSR